MIVNSEKKLAKTPFLTRRQNEVKSTQLLERHQQ